MSAKPKSSYRCREWGAVQAKWSVQSADCKVWNSLEEEAALTKSSNTNRFSGYAGTTQIRTLAEVDLNQTARLSSGLSELDRVMGGGIVNGSVTLIGGDPGIGKST